MITCECPACLEHASDVLSGETRPDSIDEFFDEIDCGIMAHASVKLKAETTARILILLKNERERSKQ